ncbi:hypothetical protein I6A60_00460 [Frankia sp. AgB1.9]|uniref:hypothetical protein n=1 Tax=unclassified Frankia TaxID=2632575 RepID=UPI0019323818|nr:MULTISPECIES: hypothetical protein [unclassified Frankia]MBL7487352.1 hypothetical protein [Frankia sp. AgW1.1]MBL7546360.1 hypothetical protein [Frankia sp. AgB1.9]MBL7618595.1 hypothetical protein [Frankia sp. AgB1.8]
MNSLTSSDPWDEHPSDYARQVAVLALDLPANSPVRQVIGAGDIPATLIIDVLDTIADNADVYAARHAEYVNQTGRDLHATVMREAISIVYATIAQALTTGGAR